MSTIGDFCEITDCVNEPVNVCRWCSKEHCGDHAGVKQHKCWKWVASPSDDEQTESGHFD